MKVSKKITSKVMGATKETILELVMADKKNEISLYHVVGNATKASIEESDNGMGEYVKLGGSFKAISKLTGEEVFSGVAILPNIAGDVIAGLLGGSDVKSVPIALTITAQYNKDASTSYVYGVEIHSQADSNPFEALEGLIPELKKALPAPKKSK